MYFMRHGQSVFNEREGCSGVDPNLPDACLSDLGHKQVSKAAKALAGRGFKRIVASPYTRALETASIVAAALDLSVEVEPLIGERRLYSCDVGTPARQLMKNWPQVDFKDFSGENWWLPFPESAQSLQRRVRDFEAKWAGDKDWRKTLFVSHYYFINAATGATPQNTEIAVWDG